ncbi:hypothetical protein JL721_3167 [Aureococcus anophagefferens]|nr:hypothetical protein JL721_3167 [Aureococcus anophagefferens]
MWCCTRGRPKAAASTPSDAPPLAPGDISLSPRASEPLKRLEATREALFDAVEADDGALVESLLAAGADADEADGDGYTALLLARKKAACPRRRASPRRDGARLLRRTALYAAAVSKLNTIDAPDAKGTSPLQHATASGFAEVIALLPSRGASDDDKGRLSMSRT